MIQVAAMYKSNPVLGLAANIAGIGVAAGYLAIVAKIAIIGFTLTMLPVASKVALGAAIMAATVGCIAGYAIVSFATEYAKLIGLCVAVVAVVVAVFAMPQLAVAGLLIAVFAVVTK